MPPPASNARSPDKTKADVALAQSNTTTSLFLGAQQRPWMRSQFTSQSPLQPRLPAASHSVLTLLDATIDGLISPTSHVPPTIADSPSLPGLHGRLPRNKSSTSVAVDVTVRSRPSPTLPPGDTSEPSIEPVMMADKSNCTQAAPSTSPMNVQTPSDLSNPPASVVMADQTAQAERGAPSSASVSNAAQCSNTADQLVEFSNDRPRAAGEPIENSNNVSSAVLSEPGTSINPVSPDGILVSRKRPAESEDINLPNTRSRRSSDSLGAATQQQRSLLFEDYGSGLDLSQELSLRKQSVPFRPPPSLEAWRLSMLQVACDCQDIFYVFLHQLYCVWSSGSATVATLQLNPVQLRGLGLLKTVLGSNAGLSPAVRSLFLTFPALEQALLREEARIIRDTVTCFLQKLIEQDAQLSYLLRARSYPLCPVELQQLLGLSSPVLQGALFRSDLQQRGAPDDWINTVQPLFDMDAKVLHHANLQHSHPLSFSYAQLEKEMQAFGAKFCQFKTQYFQKSPAPRPGAQPSPIQQSLHYPVQRSPGAFAPSIVSKIHGQPHRSHPSVLAHRGRIAVQASTTQRAHQGQPVQAITTYLAPLVSSSNGIAYQPYIRNGGSVQPHTPFTPTTPPQSASVPGLLLPSQVANSFASNYPHPQPYAALPLGFPHPGSMVHPQPQHPQFRGHPRAHPRFYRPNNPVSPGTDNQHTPVPGARGHGFPPSTPPHTSATHPSHFPQHAARRPPSMFPTDSDFQLPVLAPANPAARALHQPHLQHPSFLKLSASGVETSSRFYLVPESYFHICATDIESGVMTHTFQVGEELISCKAEDGEEKREAIPTNRQVIRNGSVLFRLKCIKARDEEIFDGTEEAQLAVAPTTWPMCLAVNLNGNYDIDFARKQHFGTDLATDITNKIQTGTNTIRLCVNFSKVEQAQGSTYHFVVEVVRTFDHESILRQPVRISHDESLKSITSSLGVHRTHDDDDDLILTDASLSIDVTDPFTSRLWNIPSRGKDCRHREAFDLESFLQSRTSRTQEVVAHPDQWRCPICRKDARPGALVLDGFLETVRRDLEADGNEGCRAILVKEDGTWVAKGGEENIGPGGQREESPQTNMADTKNVHDMDNTEAMESRGIESATRTHAMSVEVIILDDD